MLDYLTSDSDLPLYFQIVTFFPVLRQIQALDFLLLCDSQADGPIHDLEDRQRSHHGQHPRDSDSHQLVEHLGRVAIDQPDRRCRPPARP